MDDESYLGETTLAKLGIQIDTSEPDFPRREIKTGDQMEGAIGNYQFWQEQMQEKAETEPKIAQLLETLDQAKTLFELGSGAGYTARALYESFCPNLETIHTVDAVQGLIHEWMRDKLPPHHQHHHQYIADFLAQIPDQADVIQLANVPDHNLRTPADVQLLADKLVDSGILITSLETGFGEDSQFKNIFEVITTDRQLRFFKKKQKMPNVSRNSQQ